MSGVFVQTLPVAGKRVSAVRQELRDRLDIDPRSEALLDGTPADESAIVTGGSTLVFARRAGQRG
jgi:hypothetical protein